MPCLHRCWRRARVVQVKQTYRTCPGSILHSTLSHCLIHYVTLRFRRSTLIGVIAVIIHHSTALSRQSLLFCFGFSLEVYMTWISCASSCTSGTSQAAKTFWISVVSNKYCIPTFVFRLRRCSIFYGRCTLSIII